jgi:phthalate 4,5-dioxygenase reductase subunit
MPRCASPAPSAAPAIHLFELRDPAGGRSAPSPPARTCRCLAQRQRAQVLALQRPAERDRYVIAVKRDPAGRGGSVDLVDTRAWATTVEVSAPRNAFELEPRRRSSLHRGRHRHHADHAMARRARRRRRLQLYYLTRSPGDTAFRDELAGDGSRARS